MRRIIHYFVAWLLTLFLFPLLALGQGYDHGRDREKKEAEEVKVPLIDLQIERIAVGVGTIIPDAGFSFDAVYVPVQMHGIGLPFIRQGTSTGITVEFHPASVHFANGRPVIEQIDYRIWSTTRVPISAIPIRALESGSVTRMFIGTDLLLDEGGPDDFTGGFDQRMAIGGDLGIIGPGNLVIEAYLFQNNIPFAVNALYGF